MKLHTCTKDDPWTPEKSERAEHPDAEWLGSRDFGSGYDIDSYKCPHCGKYFEVEVPQ